MNRSSGISRRAAMAPNRLRTEVSPNPSTSSSWIFLIALLEREDIGRLLDPALLVEKLDLLFAQPVDIEGAARHEMAQMLDLLEGTGKLAGAMGAHTLLTAGDDLAHHVGLERTRTFFRKFVGFGATLTPFQHHAQHLRNDVAGALNRRPYRRCEHQAA